MKTATVQMDDPETAMIESDGEETDEEAEDFRQFKKTLRKHGVKELQAIEARKTYLSEDNDEDPDWIEEEVIKMAEKKDRLKRKVLHSFGKVFRVRRV